MTKPTGRPRGRPPKARQDAQANVKGDGWRNVLLNLGQTSGNPMHRTDYAPTARVDQKTAENVYRGDGLGRRVVDVLVDDAIREWIESSAELLAEFKRLGAKQEISDAAKWARLYGGAVLVALVDDGGDFDQPVNMNRVRAVRQLRAYDRHRVTWSSADIDQDPLSGNFGKPLFYRVSPPHGVPYRVHHSRAWRIDGLPLPIDARLENNGWGDSALQTVFDALRNYAMTMSASANIVRDFVQTVLGIKGLTEMLRMGEDELVAKRATIIDLTRSVANTIFTDADGETYSKQASSVAGLPELWDRFALHVSACTGIPATKLMGRSPAGMNATGDSDMRQWYDTVQAYRTDELEPMIEWLAGLIDAQSEWRTRPETMDWQWPSIMQPTDQEWADIKLKNAQADAIYIDRQAVDAEYLFHLRNGEGEYRPDVTYDHNAFMEWVVEREGLNSAE